MRPLTLQWSRRPTGRQLPDRAFDFYWLALMDTEGKHVTVPGVYVLWSPQGQGVLYVGQADNVGGALEHIRNHVPLAGAPKSAGLVTWARVESEHTRLGVERYLAEKLRPVVTAPRP